MSATEIVRRMLDERGVEHYDMQYSYATEVWWGGESFGGGGAKFTAYEQTDGHICLEMADLTPEQAIAATLGRGECKVDVLNTGDCAGYECSEYIMHCNACGHEFGHVLYNEDGDVWMSEPPNYCPNCGRRVVDPTTNDVDAEVAR